MMAEILSQVQQNPMEWIQPLINQGPIGVMLVWCVHVGSKIIGRHTRALNLNTESNMVLVLALKHLDDDHVIKQLAKGIQEKAKKEALNHDTLTD